MNNYERKLKTLINPQMIIQKNYDEIYIKIKFNSDDDSPLKKTLKLHHVVIVVRSVFHEFSKY